MAHRQLTAGSLPRLTDMAESLIFTTHAKERLKLRNLSEDTVRRVVQKPDRTKPGDKPESAVFIRKLDGRQIHVVGTYLPEQKKTLIVSTWVRGEEDPESLSWTILSAPFKLAWWLVKMVLRKLR